MKKDDREHRDNRDVEQCVTDIAAVAEQNDADNRERPAQVGSQIDDRNNAVSNFKRHVVLRVLQRVSGLVTGYADSGNGIDIADGL